MGSDAQWLAENVILPRLDALDKKLEARDKAIQQREEKMWEAIEEERKCVSKTKLKVERNNGRLNNIEEDKRRAEERNKKVDEHLGNDIIHFNKEKAEQTNLGYLAKKKVLLIFVTALSILVTTATGIAVAWMNGLIGG